MKTLKGTVKKSDIDGGVWVLDTGRNIYQLKDGPAELYQEGMLTTIKGNVKKDILGIGMIGPVFEVREMK